MTVLSDDLAIPLYGTALFIFFLWRIIASIPSHDPKYAERICRILNRFKTEPPTRLVSTFLSKVKISGTTFSFMSRADRIPGHILIIWIKEKEYAFVEKSGVWEIYYQD